MPLPALMPSSLQRTQIALSHAERQGMRALALRSGRSQSALIREAIDAFLECHQPRASGLWAKRGNLPVGATLRRELHRSTDGEGG